MHLVLSSFKNMVEFFFGFLEINELEQHGYLFSTLSCQIFKITVDSSFIRNILNL